jgi:uncharacterized membrane protein YqiK
MTNLIVNVFVGVAVFAVCAAALKWLLGIRYIPHAKVGVVEKFWSPTGSLTEGRIVALNGEAGFQTKMLRGGLHPWYFPWQYRIHKEPLVTVSEGKIGYVYARDGAPLPPTQTLGRTVESNHFQDAVAFLRNGGQRGRQRAILREGVFAINQALFVVITEDGAFSGPIKDKAASQYLEWQNQLSLVGGFDPVVIGRGSAAHNLASAHADLRELGASAADVQAGMGQKLLAADADTTLLPSDTLGIVTVHDGPPIGSGEIIAPEVKAAGGRQDHDYFQNPEAFLELGGRRGKQLQVLTDGTFFINRWFATVEIRPKMLIPIGYVGVVVSYYGSKGEDVTGVTFRYGEQVEPGLRGVWKQALPPGKFALNPYALKVELVPTVNFVLRWITGVVESHQYDKDLLSIELITADGYEPVLPLSLVLHIDYEKAPRVVQRFGDVKRLITQTLDPILTSYFRDVAQSSHMLDLLTKREEIQKRATEHLGHRFQDYDINCVAVLIGRPESKATAPGQADPIEQLFDQLRIRRLAAEQKETFARQEEAAVRLKELNHARAAAEKQTELTQTGIDVEVAANKGEAQLAEAQRLAKRDIARAEGESRSKELLGKGEGARIAQIGLSEAAVFLQKIRAYGDPRLFALSLVADQFAKSAQPLVPERLLLMSGAKDGDAKADLTSVSTLGQLLTLLLAEKAGIGVTEKSQDLEELERFTAQLTKKMSEDKAKALAEGA